MSLFTTPAELYLASADRMDHVLRNVETLGTEGPTEVESYATVVGGLSGLNYLTVLRPRQLLFFDLNPSALAYARLIVELVAMSRSPAEFISRVFRRPVSSWLETTDAPGLTVDTQADFLRQPIDPSIAADTFLRLSGRGRATFEETIGRFADGVPLAETRNCRRLLPCWPVTERVPVGAGEATGCDERGDRVPNTNTFFFGHGWLSADAAFLSVRRCLTETPCRFVCLDVLAQDLDAFVAWGESLAIHVSNIDEWFPAAWHHRWRSWRERALERQCRLTTITSHGGVTRVAADPHGWAFAGVAPFVTGEVVEVVRRHPWGFHEIPRANPTVEEYLARHGMAADTTILHVLAGEGAPRADVERVADLARRLSRRTLVLEHNRSSTDWPAPTDPRFFDEREFCSWLSADGPGAPERVRILSIAGETDNRRNLLAVIEGGEDEVSGGERVWCDGSFAGWNDAEDLDTVFRPWFVRICVPSVLEQARSETLTWEGRRLSWEVCHEILAFQRFRGAVSADDLIRASNERYARLDALWAGREPTPAALHDFYVSSAAILPWGHGVFAADHDVAARRRQWLRRVALLRQLQQRGVSSVLDYGAGGGHTSLLAKAMGFRRVCHHEYAVYHPYVAWRADAIPGGVFLQTDAGSPLALPWRVQGIICTDVAEHVASPDGMLEQMRAVLEPGGYLVWVSVFGEGLSSHLHPELAGHETRLLARHGFRRVADFPVEYVGFSGLYQQEVP